MSNNDIGCAVCCKTNVTLKIYPYTLNDVIIATIYCCDDCKDKLATISMVKNDV